MGQWYLDQLLFADDFALVVDSKSKLYQLVEELGRECGKRKLKVNESKS